MQFSCYLNDNEAFAIYSFCSMIDSPFATRTCNSEQQRAETSLKRILTFPLSKALKKCEFDPSLDFCPKSRGARAGVVIIAFSLERCKNDDGPGTWVVYERRKKIVNS